MLNVVGYGGQIQFDGQYVTITRKGFLARATRGKGEKRLHVSQISAVQWKPAGWAVNGYIQFTIPGSNEVRSRVGRQTVDAAKDENSVVFTKGQQPEFEKLRAAVDQAIAQQHAPQVTAGQVSVAEELAGLAQLRDQGVITEEDFQGAKRRLLGL
ncbi:DUF4429 domain-containing protein [Streptomyces samsunensis]|uniref:DUF4429 domain-containing protein n=1 Tax=Streptomyces malaysiensis TaxID=92644 RepID=UPI0015828ADC|nr:DUF4429 domain-containing protein [Streptomyces samsunensis]NUH35275.1 DUF4429 domain-containing protein [Streptomyces samsunensis]